MQIQPIQMPVSFTQGMIQPITPILTDAAQNAAEVSPANFKDLLRKATTDFMVGQADNSDVISLATGGEEKLHDIVISMEKSGMELQYAIAIRNKLLEAYQSVIQMQI